MGWRPAFRLAGAMDVVGPGANWTEASVYAPLLLADRSILAWEWLRRSPAYRAAAAGCGADSEVWGLLRYVPPGLAAPDARPLWTAAVHPLVLRAAAEEGVDPGDMFDSRLVGSAIVMLETGAGEHLLVSDGYRAIRLDIEAGTLRRGPVRLCYRLCGLASAGRPLLTLRRLLAYCRDGRFSAMLHPPETRAARHVLMLRAHDAMAAGANQREIAATLLCAEASFARWRIAAPTLRSRVQRLVRNARNMANGGYRELLN